MKISKTYRMHDSTLQLIKELLNDSKFLTNDTKVIEHAIYRYAVDKFGSDKVVQILLGDLKNESL